MTTDHSNPAARSPTYSHEREYTSEECRQMWNDGMTAVGKALLRMPIHMARYISQDVREMDVRRTARTAGKIGGGLVVSAALVSTIITSNPYVSTSEDASVYATHSHMMRRQQRQFMASVANDIAERIAPETEFRVDPKTNHLYVGRKTLADTLSADSRKTLEPTMSASIYR